MLDELFSCKSDFYRGVVFLDLPKLTNNLRAIAAANSSSKGK